MPAPMMVMFFIGGSNDAETESPLRLKMRGCNAG
jgi:hypothetical protein